MFDHSSHYEYLMEAAWEAVEQLHKVGSFDDYPESIASQMVREGGSGAKYVQSGRCVTEGKGLDWVRLRIWFRLRI